MKTLSLICLGLLFFIYPLVSQNRIEVALWPDGIDGLKENAPSLTVYFPDKPNGMSIIMCPGGGYDHLALSHEGHDFASWFVERGITYAVLKYRLPAGRDNVPLDDAEQAMRLLRGKASEWGINTHRVGIMGASAGGHLAASLATRYSDKEVRPDFQILLYPVISMKKEITNIGSRNKLIGENPSEELEDRYTLELQVSAGTPQAFIALSGDDKGVLPINSINYFMALQKHQIPVAMHIYTSGGHGWGFKDSFPYKEQWLSELDKWLNNGLIWQ